MPKYIRIEDLQKFIDCLKPTSEEYQKANIAQKVVLNNCAAIAKELQKIPIIDIDVNSINPEIDLHPLDLESAKYYHGMCVIEWLGKDGKKTTLKVCELNDRYLTVHDSALVMRKNQLRWNSYGKDWRVWPSLPTVQNRAQYEWGI